LKENKKMKLFDKIKKMFSLYGEPPYVKKEKKKVTKECCWSKLAESFTKDELVKDHPNFIQPERKK
jgi:hypothetical protein